MIGSCIYFHITSNIPILLVQNQFEGTWMYQECCKISYSPLLYVIAFHKSIPVYFVIYYPKTQAKMIASLFIEFQVSSNPDAYSIRCCSHY